MAKPQSLTERLIKGSSIVLSFTFLTSVLNYVLRILYSRTLSIEMYGLFFAFLSLFSALALYSDLGFGYSISYLVPKLIKHGQHAKSWDIYKYGQILGAVSSILIGLLLVTFAPWIAKEYFKVPEAQNLIYIFSIYLIACNFTTTLHALFIGLQQERYYSSIQALRIFLSIIFSILALASNSANITTYAFIAAISYVVCAIYFDYLLRKQNQDFKYWSFNWDKKLFKQMYSYAFPTLVASSIYSLIITSDTFFLTLFKGVRDVGIYNVVLPIASIPVALLSPLNNFILPMISGFMVKETNKVSALLESILKLVPFIAVYFSLFIAVFPSPPIILLFGSKWSGPSEIPLSVLSLGYVAASLSIFFTTAVMGIGKIKERINALIIIAILSIILNAIFIFYLGVLGATIATSIIHLISVIVMGKIIQTNLSFRYPLLFYLKLFLISAVLFSLIKFSGFQPVGWIVYIITGIIYTIFMVIVGYDLKIIDKSLTQLIFKKNKNG